MEVFSLNTIGHVHHFSDDPDLNSVLVFNTLQTEDKFAAMHLFQSDRVPVCISCCAHGLILQRVLMKSLQQYAHCNWSIFRATTRTRAPG